MGMGYLVTLPTGCSSRCTFALSGVTRVSTQRTVCAATSHSGYSSRMGSRAPRCSGAS